MSKKFSRKPIALALGATFALAGMSAHASVFQAADLGSGYMVASAGDHKGKEGKCGEHKCGSAEKFKAMDTDGDGKLSQEEFAAAHKKGKEAKGKEGKCGEGKCGEGKCGGEKKE